MACCITSRENETIKYACKIGQSKAFRQSEQRFLAEGLKLCLTLAGCFAASKVFYTAQALAAEPRIAALGDEAYEISDSVAQKLAETKSPQGLFVLFQMPEKIDFAPESLRRCLVLERVQDPSNIGALLRSAAAFGFDTVLLGEGCGDAFCGKALRSSMGALGALHLVQEVDVPCACEALRSGGVRVLAAALYGSIPLHEAEVSHKDRIALLIGNEGSGLTPAAIAAADVAVRIPMTDKVESLNAAVAGSVLLWHFRGV